jgi:hypothetical protein
MDFLPWTSFARSVARYGGDRRVRSLSCAEPFRAMAFAQWTDRESLRDIEACLGRNHAEVAERLIAQARRLDAGDGFGVAWNSAVYALDSTTIDLCMSLFPWRISGRPNPPSRGTRCSICTAPFQRLSAAPLEIRTMSTGSTRLLRSPELSTGWIAAISTSPGFIGCIGLEPSS